MNKVALLIHTIKYLKLKQIIFRAFYLLKSKLKIIFKSKYILSKQFVHKPNIFLEASIKYPQTYHHNTFRFINKEVIFDNNINFNYMEHGLLWNYHINYFDYLNQEDISKKTGLKLINKFIDQLSNSERSLDSYPISLRGINWIKFLTKNSISCSKINRSLYAQYYILKNNLEYHLLGNHLLENGFSLIFGSYFYQDKKLYKQGKKILKKELKNQVLNDGAHFELSPMYHNIITYRLLDVINLIKNNDWIQDELLSYLIAKAELMLGFIIEIKFKDDTLPTFNDCLPYIFPSPNKILDYAHKLNISPKTVRLSSCGYRKFTLPDYECVIDVGNIGPDYIPGHAHADTFNFELRINNKPFIVDVGTSTYENNNRRLYERSTAAHNTVEISNQNSSKVWSSFRVGERAKIIKLYEKEKRVTSSHNGYKRMGIIHTRTFLFNNNTVSIQDQLNKPSQAKAYIHFHPDISDSTIRKHLIVEDANFKIINYKFAESFNKLRDAKVAIIDFTKDLRVQIKI